MGQKRPDWVARNTNAFLDKRVFYGVGSVSDVKNNVLAQMTAENKALSEIGKILDAYAIALMHDYIASLSEDDAKKINARQNLAFAFRTYVAITLSHAVVIDSWTDPVEGTFYSLAKLKLKRFKKQIARAKELSPDIRRFVKKNAEKSFDRFKMKNEKEAPEKSDSKRDRDSKEENKEKMQ